MSNVRVKNLPSIEQMAANIIDIYHRATPAQIHAGEQWYAEARDFADALAARSIFNRQETAGVIAALSPQQAWSINKNNATRAIDTYPDVPSMHTGTQMGKVMAILSGVPPLEALKGPKERAFYLNIIGDFDHVTVDRWAYFGATGELVVGTGGIGRRVYVLVEQAYRLAAFLLGIPVAILQAVVWVVVRGGAE